MRRYGTGIQYSFSVYGGVAALPAAGRSAIGAVGVMMAARAAVVPRLGAERYLKYKN